MENDPVEIVDFPSYKKMVIFHCKMLVHQRVNLHFPMVFLWFSYGFPMVSTMGFPFLSSPLVQSPHGDNPFPVAPQTSRGWMKFLRKNRGKLQAGKISLGKYRKFMEYSGKYKLFMESPRKILHWYHPPNWGVSSVSSLGYPLDIPSGYLTKPWKIGKSPK